MVANKRRTSPSSWTRTCCTLWLAAAFVAGCGADAKAEHDVGDGGLALDGSDTAPDGDGDTSGDDVADLIGDPGSVERVELGTLKTGADGLSGELAFDLPSDVTALTISLQGPGGVWLQIAGLQRESAVALVPPAWLGISPQPSVCLAPCANRVLAQVQHAAFLFPDTSLVELIPGKQRLRIYAYRRDGTTTTPAAAEVTVVAWMVRGPLGVRRSLPLNLILTGAAGLTPDTAPAHPEFQAALAELRKRLALAGLEVAPIRMFAGDPKSGFVLTRSGPDNDLDALFASATGLPEGLNLFVVETIYASSGNGGPPGLDLLLGLSGGIPGVHAAPGSPRAGIAVAADVDDPLRFGRTMAHEIGHYLGLFHTTEAKDGEGDAVADPLPDTPAPDPSNLMHWTVGNATVALRHEQIQVLLRSPLLRASGAR